MCFQDCNSLLQLELKVQQDVRASGLTPMINPSRVFTCAQVSPSIRENCTWGLFSKAIGTGTRHGIRHGVRQMCGISGKGRPPNATLMPETRP